MSFFDSGSTGAELTDPASVIEDLGAELAGPGSPRLMPEEIVSGFVARTPLLTFSERAELLGEVMENHRTVAGAPGRSPSRPAPRSARRAPAGAQRPTRGRGGGFDWGRLASALRTGLDVFQQGAQVISQFSRSRGQPAPTAGTRPTGPRPPAPGARPGAPAGGFGPQQLDQIAALLQALRSRQIPPLPGRQPAPGAAAGAPGAPLDATAMLQSLLGNPRLRQALQRAAVLGRAAPRAVELPLPASGAPGGSRTVRIPLGAVLNTVMGLARQSMAELNANTAEDDPALPEYLVGEDGELLVDPANPDERAALVEHLFRLSEEAERAGWFEEGGGAYEDESDAWAREAGWSQ